MRTDGVPLVIGNISVDVVTATAIAVVVGIGLALMLGIRKDLAVLLLVLGVLAIALAK